MKKHTVIYLPVLLIAFLSTLSSTGIREPYHQLSRLRHYLHFFCEHVGLEPVTDKDQKE